MLARQRAAARHFEQAYGTGELIQVPMKMSVSRRGRFVCHDREGGYITARHDLARRAWYLGRGGVDLTPSGISDREVAQKGLGMRLLKSAGKTQKTFHRCFPVSESKREVKAKFPPL